MSDDYTQRAGIIKPEVGQNLNIWGTKLNGNALDLIDVALCGFLPIAVTGDFALTGVNGDSTSTQINKAIRLGGVPSADFTVTFMSKEQCILFHNATSKNATVKVSAGTGVTLAAGELAFLGYNATYGDVTLVSPTRFSGAMTTDNSLTINGTLSGLQPGTTGTQAINKNQLDNALAGMTSVTSPGTLKVSATDTTANYLNQKILVDGIFITKSTQNPGANENVLLAGTGKLFNSASDTTAGYVNTKVTVSGSLLAATTNPGANEATNISTDDGQIGLYAEAFG